ncbi:hypothetical protein BJ508DRAFT_382170 [Ascobolus immersus RN42]|uniref:Uncharacterized protein n=1 Tax=Ascobolus immersus RN42 TaxID=1160509 RepID=A0A3N4H8M2_ASCIM|nr:hypothetical protein BJ508DRAFT_382170 [Ascobolus immersus RN42]
MVDPPKRPATGWGLGKKADQELKSWRRQVPLFQREYDQAEARQKAAEEEHTAARTPETDYKALKAQSDTATAYRKLKQATFNVADSEAKIAEREAHDAKQADNTLRTPTSKSIADAAAEKAIELRNAATGLREETKEAKERADIAALAVPKMPESMVEAAKIEAAEKMKQKVDKNGKTNSKTNGKENGSKNGNTNDNKNPPKVKVPPKVEEKVEPEPVTKPEEKHDPSAVEEPPKDKEEVKPEPVKPVANPEEKGDPPKVEAPPSDKEEVKPETVKKPEETEDPPEVKKAAWDLVVIPKENLIKESPHLTFMRMVPGMSDGDYWASEGFTYLRFLMDFYLGHKQGWNPLYRDRLEFLSNRKKIRKICEELSCSAEDYVTFFELDKTTREQRVPSNYAPAWYMALAAIRKDAELGKEFYKTVWKVTFGRDPLLSVGQKHLLKLFPPGAELVEDWEKYQDIDWFEEEPKSDISWYDFIKVQWDTIENLERNYGKGLHDNDPDFDAADGDQC